MPDDEPPAPDAGADSDMHRFRPPGAGAVPVLSLYRAQAARARAGKGGGAVADPARHPEDAAGASAAASLPRLVAALAATAPGSDRHRLLQLQVQAAAASAARAIRTQTRRIALLEKLAETDELTGVLNRRGFALRLRARLAEARRHGEHGVVLFLDLDDFKQMNDRHGHALGDVALARLAAALTGAVRRSDDVGRLGGDEFGMILYRGRPVDAQAQAARIAGVVRKLVLASGTERIALSASVGWTVFDGTESEEAVMAEADAAMYRRKSARAADTA